MKKILLFYTSIILHLGSLGQGLPEIPNFQWSQHDSDTPIARLDDKEMASDEFIATRVEEAYFMYHKDSKTMFKIDPSKKGPESVEVFGQSEEPFYIRFGDGFILISDNSRLSVSGQYNIINAKDKIIFYSYITDYTYHLEDFLEKEGEMLPAISMNNSIYIRKDGDFQTFFRAEYIPRSRSTIIDKDAILYDEEGETSYVLYDVYTSEASTFHNAYRFTDPNETLYYRRKLDEIILVFQGAKIPKEELIEIKGNGRDILFYHPKNHQVHIIHKGYSTALKEFHKTELARARRVDLANPFWIDLEGDHDLFFMNQELIAPKKIKAIKDKENAFSFSYGGNKYMFFRNVSTDETSYRPRKIYPYEK